MQTAHLAAANRDIGNIPFGSHVVQRAIARELVELPVSEKHAEDSYHFLSRQILANAPLLSLAKRQQVL